MSTLYLYQFANVTIDGELLPMGSRAKPVELEVGERVEKPRKTVPAGETWDLWDATIDSAVETLGFLWVESDIDGVELELTVDAGNQVGKRTFAIGLVADVPFILPTKAALANYTEDFAAGAVDAIERVRVRNPSGATSAANIRALIIDEAD